MARLPAGNRFVVKDFGTCLNFLRSSSQYVLIKSAFLLGGQTNATVSIWIKTTSTQLGGVPNVLYAESGATGNDLFKFEVIQTSGGILRFTYRDDAGTLTQITASTKVATGLWTYVVVTKSGTAILIYANGVQVGSGTLSGTNNFTNTSVQCRLGGDQRDATAYYSGLMDEVRLYTRALSPSEITSLYYTTTTTSAATNLVGYYKLDEGAGTTATDSSGNGNNGTLTGAVYSTDVFGKPRVAIPQSTFNNYIRGSYKNSSDGYFSITHNTLLKPTGDYTVEAFLLPRLNNYYQSFLAIKNSASPFIYMGIDNSNHWTFNFKSITSVVPSNDTKVHFAAVYDSVNNKIYGFVDGVLCLNTTNNSVTTGGGTNTVFIMKQEDDAVNQTWKGGIDELRFSNTQRYAGTTVGNTYFAPPTVPFTSDSNTLLLLHMDDLGATIRDSGPSGFTVTKTGADLVLRQAYTGRFIAA